MKKHLANIVGIVLGLCFLAASIPVLFKLMPEQKIPGGTPVFHFMAAFGPTGWITFIKLFELAGAILVMIPRLRNIGLLLLCPILVNIIAFHVLLDSPKSLLNPLIIVIVVCVLYLLGNARGKLAGLLN